MKNRFKTFSTTDRAIALLLVFAMVMSLFIGTGITQHIVGTAEERQPICGMEEHIHSAECYVVTGGHYLTCGQNTGIMRHQHNQYCYDADGNMVCHIIPCEYHVHTDECRYIEQRAVCGKDNTVVHVHGDSCFAGGDALKAYLDAALKHQHDNDCYEWQLVCKDTSEGHTHDRNSGCFSKTLICGFDTFLATYNGGDIGDDTSVLICGMQAGQLEHVHTEDCYQDFVVTCGKIDSPVYPVHNHTADCWSDSATVLEPQCGKTEHQHSDSCYPQPAPVEVEEPITVNFHDMTWEDVERESLTVRLSSEEEKSSWLDNLLSGDKNEELVTISDSLVPQAAEPEDETAGIAARLENEVHADSAELNKLLALLEDSVFADGAKVTECTWYTLDAEGAKAPYFFENLLEEESGAVVDLYTYSYRLHIDMVPSGYEAEEDSEDYSPVEVFVREGKTIDESFFVVDDVSLFEVDFVEKGTSNAVNLKGLVTGLTRNWDIEVYYDAEELAKVYDYSLWDFRLRNGGDIDNPYLDISSIPGVISGGGYLKVYNSTWTADWGKISSYVYPGARSGLGEGVWYVIRTYDPRIPLKSGQIIRLSDIEIPPVTSEDIDVGVLLATGLEDLKLHIFDNNGTYRSYFHTDITGAPFADRARIQDDIKCGEIKLSGMSSDTKVFSYTGISPNRTWRGVSLDSFLNQVDTTNLNIQSSGAYSLATARNAYIWDLPVYVIIDGEYVRVGFAAATGVSGDDVQFDLSAIGAAVGSLGTIDVSSKASLGTIRVGNSEDTADKMVSRSGAEGSLSSGRLPFSEINPTSSYRVSGLLICPGSELTSQYITRNFNTLYSVTVDGAKKDGIYVRGGSTRTINIGAGLGEVDITGATGIYNNSTGELRLSNPTAPIQVVTKGYGLSHPIKATITFHAFDSEAGDWDAGEERVVDLTGLSFATKVNSTKTAPTYYISTATLEQVYAKNLYNHSAAYNLKGAGRVISVYWESSLGADDSNLASYTAADRIFGYSTSDSKYINMDLQNWDNGDSDGWYVPVGNDVSDLHVYYFPPASSGDYIVGGHASVTNRSTSYLKTAAVFRDSGYVKVYVSDGVFKYGSAPELGWGEFHIPKNYNFVALVNSQLKSYQVSGGFSSMIGRLSDGTVREFSVTSDFVSANEYLYSNPLSTINLYSLKGTSILSVMDSVEISKDVKECNIGADIYALVDNRWVKVNDTSISLEGFDYPVIGISGLDNSYARGTTFKVSDISKYLEPYGFNLESYDGEPVFYARPSTSTDPFIAYHSPITRDGEWYSYLSSDLSNSESYSVNIYYVPQGALNLDASDELHLETYHDAIKEVKSAQSSDTFIRDNSAYAVYINDVLQGYATVDYSSIRDSNKLTRVWTDSNSILSTMTVDSISFDGLKSFEFVTDDQGFVLGLTNVTGIVKLYTELPLDGTTAQGTRNLSVNVILNGQLQTAIANLSVYHYGVQNYKGANGVRAPQYMVKFEDLWNNPVIQEYVEYYCNGHPGAYADGWAPQDVLDRVFGIVGDDGAISASAKYYTADDGTVYIPTGYAENSLSAGRLVLLLGNTGEDSRTAGGVTDFASSQFFTVTVNDFKIGLSSCGGGSFSILSEMATTSSDVQTCDGDCEYTVSDGAETVVVTLKDVKSPVNIYTNKRAFSEEQKESVKLRVNILANEKWATEEEDDGVTGVSRVFTFDAYKDVTVTKHVGNKTIMEKMRVIPLDSLADALSTSNNFIVHNIGLSHDSFGGTSIWKEDAIGTTFSDFAENYSGQNFLGFANSGDTQFITANCEALNINGVWYLPIGSSDADVTDVYVFTPASESVTSNEFPAYSTYHKHSDVSRLRPYGVYSVLAYRDVDGTLKIPTEAGMIRFVGYGRSSTKIYSTDVSSCSVLYGDLNVTKGSAGEVTVSNVRSEGAIVLGEPPLRVVTPTDTTSNVHCYIYSPGYSEIADTVENNPVIGYYPGKFDNSDDLLEVGYKDNVTHFQGNGTSLYRLAEFSEIYSRFGLNIDDVREKKCFLNFTVVGGNIEALRLLDTGYLYINESFGEEWFIPSTWDSYISPVVFASPNDATLLYTPVLHNDNGYSLYLSVKVADAIYPVFLTTQDSSGNVSREIVTWVNAGGSYALDLSGIRYITAVGDSRTTFDEVDDYLYISNVQSYVDVYTGDVSSTSTTSMNFKVNIDGTWTDLSVNSINWSDPAAVSKVDASQNNSVTVGRYIPFEQLKAAFGGYLSATTANYNGERIFASGKNGTITTNALMPLQDVDGSWFIPVEEGTTEIYLLPGNLGEEQAKQPVEYTMDADFSTSTFYSMYIEGQKINANRRVDGKAVLPEEVLYGGEAYFYVEDGQSIGIVQGPYNGVKNEGNGTYSSYSDIRGSLFAFLEGAEINLTEEGTKTKDVKFYALIDGTWTQVGGKVLNIYGNVSGENVTYGMVRGTMTATSFVNIADFVEIYGSDVEVNYDTNQYGNLGFVLADYDGERVFGTNTSSDGVYNLDFYPRTFTLDGVKSYYMPISDSVDSIYFFAGELDNQDGDAGIPKQHTDKIAYGASNFYTVKVEHHNGDEVEGVIEYPVVLRGGDRIVDVSSLHQNGDEWNYSGSCDGLAPEGEQRYTVTNITSPIIVANATLADTGVEGYVRVFMFDGEQELVLLGTTDIIYSTNMYPGTKYYVMPETIEKILQSAPELETYVNEMRDSGGTLLGVSTTDRGNYPTVASLEASNSMVYYDGCRLLSGKVVIPLGDFERDGHLDLVYLPGDYHGGVDTADSEGHATRIDNLNVVKANKDYFVGVTAEDTVFGTYSAGPIYNRAGRSLTINLPNVDDAYWTGKFSTGDMPDSEDDKSNPGDDESDSGMDVLTSWTYPSYVEVTLDKGSYSTPGEVKLASELTVSDNLWLDTADGGGWRNSAVWNATPIERRNIDIMENMVTLEVLGKVESSYSMVRELDMLGTLDVNESYECWGWDHLSYRTITGAQFTIGAQFVSDNREDWMNEWNAALKEYRYIGNQTSDGKIPIGRYRVRYYGASGTEYTEQELIDSGAIVLLHSDWRYGNWQPYVPHIGSDNFGIDIYEMSASFESDRVNPERNGDRKLYLYSSDTQKDKRWVSDTMASVIADDGDEMFWILPIGVWSSAIKGSVPSDTDISTDTDVVNKSYATYNSYNNPDIYSASDYRGDGTFTVRCMDLSEPVHFTTKQKSFSAQSYLSIYVDGQLNDLSLVDGKRGPAYFENEGHWRNYVDLDTLWNTMSTYGVYLDLRDRNVDNSFISSFNDDYSAYYWDTKSDMVGAVEKRIVVPFAYKGGTLETFSRNRMIYLAHNPEESDLSIIPDEEFIAANTFHTVQVEDRVAENSIGYTSVSSVKYVANNGEYIAVLPSRGLDYPWKVTGSDGADLSTYGIQRYVIGVAQGDSETGPDVDGTGEGDDGTSAIAAIKAAGSSIVANWLDNYVTTNGLHTGDTIIYIGNVQGRIYIRSAVEAFPQFDVHYFVNVPKVVTDFGTAQNAVAWSKTDEAKNFYQDDKNYADSTDKGYYQIGDEDLQIFGGSDIKNSGKYDITYSSKIGVIVRQDSIIYDTDNLGSAEKVGLRGQDGNYLNNGGSLPVNGGSSTDRVKQLYFYTVGQLKYEVLTYPVLSELYQMRTYYYDPYPSTLYFDILRESENYSLQNIWVQVNYPDKDDVEWYTTDNDAAMVDAWYEEVRDLPGVLLDGKELDATGSTVSEDIKNRFASQVRLPAGKMASYPETVTMEDGNLTPGLDSFLGWRFTYDEVSGHYILWYVYRDPNTVPFKNIKQSLYNTIWVHDGVVYRMEYNGNTADQENVAVTMYDYDISNGVDSNGVMQVWNESDKANNKYSYYGVNSAQNYPDNNVTTGSIFRFGNDNSGVRTNPMAILGTANVKERERMLWNGSTINVYNGTSRGADKNSFKGGTFGMVVGWNPDTFEPIFAKGISAPKMFSPNPEADNLIGIYKYDDFSVNFNRSGDTFILSSVERDNTVIQDDLQYLFNPAPEASVYEGSVSEAGNAQIQVDYDGDGKEELRYWHGHIVTNNFWPLSTSATKNKDPFNMGFTLNSNGGFSNTQRIWGRSATSSNAVGASYYYPCVDQRVSASPYPDGYNQLFGMKYQLKFKIPENYVGPLDIFVYGDDDIWIFMDDELVADLGGVHSTFGMYANLWDYIHDVDDLYVYGSNSGEHTVSVFYTERGNSGSTCWMMYTLPLDNEIGVRSERLASTLTLEKQVVESETQMNKPYTFQVDFKRNIGSASNPVWSLTEAQEFSYILLNENGDILDINADSTKPAFSADEVTYNSAGKPMFRALKYTVDWSKVANNLKNGTPLQDTYIVGDDGVMKGTSSGVSFEFVNDSRYSNTPKWAPSSKEEQERVDLQGLPVYTPTNNGYVGRLYIDNYCLTFGLPEDANGVPQKTIITNTSQMYFDVIEDSGNTWTGYIYLPITQKNVMLDLTNQRQLSLRPGQKAMFPYLETKLGYTISEVVDSTYTPSWSVTGGHYYDDEGNLISMENGGVANLAGTSCELTLATGDVVLGSSISGIVNDGNYSISDADTTTDYYFKVSVVCTNTPVNINGALPETGGVGTIIFYVVGFICFISAIWLGKRNRKMRRDARK